MLEKHSPAYDIHVSAQAALHFAVEQPPVSSIQHGTHGFMDGVYPVGKCLIGVNGLMFAGYAAPVLAGTMIDQNSPIINNIQLGAGAVIASSIAVNVHTYSGKRANTLRSSTMSRGALQSHFKQPIDADQSGIRWYGFDKNYHKPGYDPASATDEFANLVDAAKTCDNEEIIVSAAVLDCLPDPVAFDNHKVTGSLHGRILDKHADPELLHLPIAEAIELKDILIESHRGQNIARSLKILNQIDPNHPAPGIFERDGFSSLTALENALRLRIETRASGATGIQVKFESKAPSVVLRGNSLATVQGRKVMFFSETPLEKRSGQGTRTFDGSETIGGDKSISELFRQINHKIANGSKPVDEVEQLAWLSLQDYKEVRSIAPGDAQPLYESVGARLQAEKPRAFPYLRRYAKGYDADNSSIEFHSPRRKDAAIVAGGALLVGALFYIAHPMLDNGGEGSGTSDAIVDADGSTAFSDAESVADSNNTVWKLAVPDGVNASGYWPQVNIDNLDIENINNANALAVAPYKDIRIEASPTENRFDGLQEITQSRPLPEAITLTGEAYIPLTGRNVRSKNGHEYHERLLALPVITGAFVSSAEISLSEGATKVANEPGFGEPTPHIYMMPDGSYYLGLESYGPVTENVKIKYTVERRSGTVRTFRADTYTNYSDGRLDGKTQPVYDAITHDNAVQIAKSLPGSAVPPVTDIRKIAEAVRTSHTYSLTPYKDAGDKAARIRSGPEDIKAGANILKHIGMTAASIDSAICNTAALQTLLMARGLDESGGPVQLTTGFANNGDNHLTSAEGYMWLTDTDGAIIEPTPAGYLDVAMSSEQKMDLAIKAGKISAATIIAAGALYLGGRKTSRLYRRAKLKSIAAALEPADPADAAKLTQSVAFYEWLKYAPDRQYTPDQISRVLERPTVRSTASRIQSLPAVPRRQLNSIIRERQHTSAELPADVVRDVRTLVDKLQYQRKHG